MQLYLSPRETEALTWFCCGLTYSGIATKMGLKRNTVKNQLTSARLKLHAQSTGHAAYLALIQGVIDVEKIQAAESQKRSA